MRAAKRFPDRAPKCGLRGRNSDWFEFHIYLHDL
jgi:hypothetical protein